MTKDEIEIIRCALVQLLMKNKEEQKQIENIINKINEYEKNAEVIE